MTEQQKELEKEGESGCCIGFARQGFRSRGATGVTSVGSCQKLPPCLTEPMPASSKTDLTLAKAEAISDGASTSVVTNLRRKKTLRNDNLQQERGVRICERNNSADTKVSEAEGAGGAPDVGAEVPLQPMEQTMVRQGVPLQISTCTPWRTPWWSRWMPEGGCDPMGSSCWSRLLEGPAEQWREEPMLEQACWQGL